MTTSTTAKPAADGCDPDATTSKPVATVVCPYTTIHPDTAAALADIAVRYVEMVDDTSYYRLLADLWAAGDTFVVVEHDIVVRPGVADELMACPEDWCGFPYRFLGGLHNGLGCAKFSARLLAEHPNVIADTSEEHTPTHPRNHWCNLDDRITRQLVRRGVAKHAHGPPVEHRKAGRTGHGCLENGWNGDITR